jgi:hypothetical protein
VTGIERVSPLPETTSILQQDLGPTWPATSGLCARHATNLKANTAEEKWPSRMAHNASSLMSGIELSVVLRSMYNEYPAVIYAKSHPQHVSNAALQCYKQNQDTRVMSWREEHAIVQFIWVELR